MSGEYQDCFSSTTQQEYFLGCDLVDDPPSGPGYTQTTGAQAMGKVVQSMSLSNAGKQNLLNTIVEMLEACAYNFMFNNVNKKFTDVVVDPALSLGGASYNTANGGLKFKYESSIGMSLFPHEFIHLYQDGLYPGGINQYTNNTGLPNIDFEASFLSDFFRYLYGLQGMDLGAAENSPLFNDYKNWLRGLCHFWETDPFDYGQFLSYMSPAGNTYWDFMLNFKNYNPNVSNQSINYSLKPAVIEEFIYYFHCY